MSDSPIIRLEGVTKLYGGIAALQSADFDCSPAKFTRLSERTAPASPPCAN